MSDIFFKTVNQKLEALWNTQPDKNVMIFRDDNDARTVLTNTDVRDLSTRCAAYMASHGVKKGDIVCNMLTASIEREIVNFGVLLAGGVVMNGGIIDNKSRAFWQPLRQAKVKFIVVSPDPTVTAWNMLKDDVGRSDADVELITRTSDVPELKKVFKFHLEHRIQSLSKESSSSRYRSTFDILRAYKGHYSEVAVRAQDPCLIMLGKDKTDNYYQLVLRDHLSVIKIGHRLEAMFGSCANDVIYDDIPLSWIPGLPYHYITLGCTFVRSTLPECPERKVIVDTWELIVQENITMAALTFPMVQMLSSQCDDLAQPHHMLRVLTTSGHGQHARESMLDAIGIITKSLVTCYSRIEAGLVARFVVNESNKDKYIEGCVGDLVNPNQRHADEIAPKFSKFSSVGEILLDGALVVKEYYNDPDLTKVSFTEDGFFFTGDIGFYNESGQLFVLGRKSDAIIRCNVPIFPRQIEEKVAQCPGVWKVKIVSIKDERGVVQMCACVIPRSSDTVTIEAVKEYFRYQLGGTNEEDDNPHMPSYIFFFDSYPTAAGGVNRRMLAYMANEILRGNTHLN